LQAVNTYTLRTDSSLCSLLDLEHQCAVRMVEGKLTARATGQAEGWSEMAASPPEHLGSSAFRERFGTRFAYMAGAMANGIASEKLVIGVCEAGGLGSFGAAGLSRSRIQSAIRQIQAARLNGPFAVNLIHSPGSPEREMETVEDCLNAGVEIIEASAFMKLEPSVVCFRASGCFQGPDGIVRSRRRVVAKLSRCEVAEAYLRPPTREMLDALVSAGRVTAEQARWAEQIPVANAITAEADSGGHTDRQPLVTLLPAILRLRDDIQNERAYPEPVLIGAAGGLGTPASLAAAFAMGADYVVTGSINQSCLEAGTSDKAKELLAMAEPSDVAMAPAADMFEMGVQVQVLKRGTLFPMRAQRLAEIYRQCESLDELSAADRQSLEKQCFRSPLEKVWQETENFLAQHQPRFLADAQQSPRKRMGACFRWYLGQASKWAVSGQSDRVTDFQIWCGPAMGAFNRWARGSSLGPPAGRTVSRVAQALLRGAAFLGRLQTLRSGGFAVPSRLFSLGPDEFLECVPASSTARAPFADQTRQTAVVAPQRRAGPREIAAFLAQQIAEHLGIGAQEIDTQLPFESFGLDSVNAMLTLKRLEEWLGVELPPTLIWNYPTVHLLAQRLGRKA
jgi:trans-AT polyketide synthase/acyltransferase/oxidoreductase domain-containing protein